MQAVHVQTLGRELRSHISFRQRKKKSIFMKKKKKEKEKSGNIYFF